jgi:hypothetical protein
VPQMGKRIEAPRALASDGSNWSGQDVENRSRGQRLPITHTVGLSLGPALSLSLTGCLTPASAGGSREPGAVAKADKQSLLSVAAAGQKEGGLVYLSPGSSGLRKGFKDCDAIPVAVTTGT